MSGCWLQLFFLVTYMQRAFLVFISFMSAASFKGKSIMCCLLLMISFVMVIFRTFIMIVFLNTTRFIIVVVSGKRNLVSRKKVCRDKVLEGGLRCKNLDGLKKSLLLSQVRDICQDTYYHLLFKCIKMRDLEGCLKDDFFY